MEVPGPLFKSEVSQVVPELSEAQRKGLRGGVLGGGHTSFFPEGGVLGAEPEPGMGPGLGGGRPLSPPCSQTSGPRRSAGQVPLGAASLTNEKIMPLNQE